MLKKRYLFLIMIVCLVSISAVSAETVSNETNDVLALDNEDSMVNEEMIVGLGDVLSMSLDDELISINREWYVNSSWPHPGNGSKDNPYHNLEFALNKVNDGDTIYIASSLYQGKRNLNLTIDKQINIQGVGSNVTFDGENNSYFFKITANSVYINNLIFKNGNSTSNNLVSWTGDYGILKNCNFINNTASGGSIISWSGKYGVLNKGNFINGIGSAVHWSGTNGSLKDSSFINSSSKQDGGAIYWEGSNGHLDNSYFINNKAINNGGAICSISNIFLNNCKFINNLVTSISSNGGAIYSYNEACVNNCAFINNSAKTGSAVCKMNKKDLNITNSTFSNHDSSSIYIRHKCQVNIENCNFNHSNIMVPVSFDGEIKMNICGCNFTNNIDESIHGGLNVINSNFFNNSGTRIIQNLDSNSIFVNNSFINNNAYYSVILAYCPIINGTFINNSCQYSGILSGGYNNIDNCIFINNSGLKGGAIYSMELSNITNCYFYNNTAESGGGIYFAYSNNNFVINCNFTENSASFGGAIFSNNDGNKLHIIQSIFNNNNAEYGGAIQYLGDNCLINNSVFNNNIADNGGALYIGGLNNGVDKLILNNNSAKYGGAILITGENTLINNSLFKYNNASIIGGAIQFISGNNNLIYNSTFMNNFAPYGSAIQWYCENGLVNNSIFINNKGTYTGTIHIVSDNITVSNTILINNTDPYDIYSTVTTVANNNWFGNTLNNQLIIPNVFDDVIIDNWHYLDANADSDTLKLGESAVVNIDLNQLTNNKEKIGYNDELQDIVVTISTIKGESNVSSVKLKNGKAKVSFISTEVGYGTLTVNYLNVSQDVIFKIKDDRIEPNMTFEVENKHIGETVEIKTLLPSDATGNITLTINNKTYSAKINNGEALILIDDLPINKYEFIIDYDGDEKYSFDRVNGSVLVSKISDFNITVDNITVYGNQAAEIVVYVPSDATGKIILYILSDMYELPVVEGKATISILDLSGYSMCGFIAVLVDDPKYEIKDVYGTITILPKVSDYDITAENITIYGDQTAEIVINVPSDATGNIILTVLYDQYVLPVIEGKATKSISGLSDYSMCGFIGILVNDPKYDIKDVYGTITILPKVSDYEIYSPDIDVYCGETANITVYLPQDATGRLKVWYDDMDIGYVYINEGVATFETSYQISCVHTFDFYYEGDYKYTPKYTSVVLTVHKFSDYPFNTSDVYIEIGETARIIANLPSDASGPADIEVFNENIDFVYSTDVENGQIICDVNGLGKDVDFVISYFGDFRYESNSVSGHIFVKNIIIITAPNVTKYYDGPESFVVTLKDKLGNPITNAAVKININSVDYTKTTDNNGIASLDLDFDVGTYDATVSYQDVSTTAKITINQLNTETNISSTKNSYNAVTLTAIVSPTTATGDVIFTVNNENYTAEINDGKATYALSNLEAGSYDAKATYNGETNYNASASNTITFTIEELKYNVTAPDLTKYYHGPERFVVTVKDKDNKLVVGKNVSICLNGATYTRTTNENGEASMAINLNSGVYNVTSEFEGIEVQSTITVKSTVSGENITKIFRNGTQYYSAFVDTSGKALVENTAVEFNINGVFYTRYTNDKGVARMNINLNPGEYIITAKNPVSEEQYTNIITVLPSIVEVHNLTKYYKNESKLTFRLLDDQGKPVGAGVIAKININGVFYERKTNASGYVNMNINLNPGTYIATLEYNGLMASSTVTVLSILEANNLVMKYKDGSKFEAKLLDGQGNPFAGQSITFNINGVFYNRPTDENGIARLAINLMAGEYIITSMYEPNGAAISNKVTVRS